MKGYELAEAIDNGLFSLEQRVNGAGYFYCTIGFILKEVGTNFLFKDFEIIEEQEEIDIQNIEEIEPTMNGNACVIDNKTWTLNQVIKAVKQLDRKIKEK